VEVIDPQKFAEENPNSVFRLTNVAMMNPGVCIICGSSGGDGRQFIDTGKTFDWWGVVYWCTFCLEEVAKLLGLKDVSEREAFALELEQKAINADSKFQAAQEQIDAYRVLLRNCNCSGADFDSNASAPVSVDGETDSEAESHVGDDGESAGLEGSGDISETSGDSESVDESGAAKSSRRSRKPAE
jgi:hypothetical protein